MTIDKECWPSNQKRRLRSSGMADPEKLADLLKRFDSCKMCVYPVSSTCAQRKNDEPECAEEIKTPEEVADAAVTSMAYPEPLQFS
jgi:hypothetical protein